MATKKLRGILRKERVPEKPIEHPHTRLGHQYKEWYEALKDALPKLIEKHGLREWTPHILIAMGENRKAHENYLKELTNQFSSLFGEYYDKEIAERLKEVVGDNRIALHVVPVDPKELEESGIKINEKIEIVPILRFLDPKKKDMLHSLQVLLLVNRNNKEEIEDRIVEIYRQKVLPHVFMTLPLMGKRAITEMIENYDEKVIELIRRKREEERQRHT